VIHVAPPSFVVTPITPTSASDGTRRSNPRSKWPLLESEHRVLDALRAFEASTAPAQALKKLGGKKGPFAMDARISAAFRRSLALTGNCVLVRRPAILHALRACL
jgi:hypothetical protein